jgi:hypothetical protein
MYQWKKLGKVFDPTTIKDIPWMQEFAQAPCTLVFDDFVRVYFSCRPPRDQKGQYVSYSSFVDLDRRNLQRVLRVHTKPVIELGALGTFDEFGIYPISVIRKGDDLLAYYAGWTRCESVPFNVAIGMAISKDNGESFQRLGDGPILSYTLNEPFVLSGPKIRKFNDTFYLFYIAGTKWIPHNSLPEPVYKIRMAISHNGYDWVRMDKNLIENRIEEDEAQASPDVIYYNGKYHMFFCYRYSLNYRGKDFGYRIGYASSEDLINWKREDSRAGLDISEEGWDSEMVAYPHVFELDGKINMFYLGNQVGRYGFGLAELEGAL